MFKRILAAIFCLCLVFAVGCKNTSDTTSTLSAVESAPEPSAAEPSEKLTVNPLTGEADLKNAAAANQRPVAVVINNRSDAQSVQTGVSKADIIYETEVEGGITRMLAVYQDISALDKIGTVRSARYHFIELAQGHNAVYVHCGQNVYAKSLLNSTDHIDLGTSNGGVRISNGATKDSTLYAKAGDLWKYISKNRKTAATNKSFANFTDEKLNLTDGSATELSVNFPTTSSDFKYDSATGLYTHTSGNKALKDYFSGEQTSVKNVFILLAKKTYFEDNHTPRMILDSGEGYYITNGTYQKINWSKGNSKNGFKFTDANGTEIKVNAGNSWVCIANKSTFKPNFK